MTKKISFITRTVTQNQGNQALSVAWRDYLASRFPEAQVCLFERIPKYLRRYTLSALAAQSDPATAFDSIASHLLERMPINPSPDPSVWTVRFDPAQRRTVRFARLRQMLSLRTKIAAFSLGAERYFSRLRHITQADLVVVNPAGEFNSSSTDTALLYLLETRCAQLAGCRTAVVNLSFEVIDPMLILLSNHVFSHCEVLEFRDEESRSWYNEKGGRSDVAVLPDAVLICGVSQACTQGRRGIAIAINGLQIADLGLTPMVRDFLTSIAASEPITLTSNEWTTDRPYWNNYFGHSSVEFSGHGLDYDAYARFLADFDIVISSRLHTCVLAMLAGTAVIPIECGTFKLTGFFNQLGMNNEPIQLGADAWQATLTDKLAEVRADRDARVALQNARVAAAASLLSTGLDELFCRNLLFSSDNKGTE